MLAAGASNGMVHLWDVKSGRLTSSLEGHQDSVTSVSFSSDSKTLFSSSYEGLINAWSAKQPPHPVLATIGVDVGKVWATAVSTQSSRVAVGGRGGFVKIIDLKTGQQVSQLTDVHPTTVDCLEFSQDGSLIATGGWRS